MTIFERYADIVLAAQDVANGSIGDVEAKINFYKREYFYKNNGDFEKFISMIFKLNSMNTLTGGLL